MMCMARPLGGRQIPLFVFGLFGGFELRKFLILFICVASLAQTGWAAESQPVTSEHDVATLVTDRDSVGPDQAVRVGLRLKLKPGWHTYWLNAGDAGEAPTLKVTASGGMKGQSDKIDWPTPVRISEGGLMSYAYTGDVVLPERLELRGRDGVQLKAHAEWLVCAATCVPESGDFSLDLPGSAQAAAPGVQAPLFDKAEAARPVPSPFAATIAPDGRLSLSGQGLSAHSVSKAWFMPSVSGVIDQVAPQKLEMADGRLSLQLKWLEGAHKNAPLSGIVVLQDAAGQQSPLWIDAKSGAAGPMPQAGGKANIGQIVLFAFLGGLILNLMPCVFPVLAMKGLSLARMGGTHRRAQVTSAAFYTGGVMLTFGALGAAMIGLRAAGSVAGWGFQFQSPVFVVAVGWLLFMMALNLLGVFEITTGGIGQDVMPREGHWGDALTGLLAVVVATPCTAPFMGAAIAAALSGPAWAGLAIFLAMGFGLASPYVLIACVPAIARRMPKPGAWMAVLKQALAFPLLATCVWLLWVATLQRGADVVVIAVGGAVGLGLAAWLFGMGQRQAMLEGASKRVVVCRSLAAVAALLTFASLARVDEGRASSGPVVAQQAGVVPFSEKKLAEARAQGKPVFVDMTAAWCITCMVNERVAIDTPAVQAAFAKQGVVYMKGDWTNRDEKISTYLRQHGRDGVPFYVYYPPHGEEKILPQLLSPGIVQAALKKGSEGGA